MNKQQRANRTLNRSRRKSGNAKHRAQPQHTEPNLCLVAGAVTLGIGYALLGSSATAHADDTASASSSSAGTSNSSSRADSVRSTHRTSPTSTASRDRLGAAAPIARPAASRSGDPADTPATGVAVRRPAVAATLSAAAAAAPVSRAALATPTRPSSGVVVSDLLSLFGPNPVSTKPAAAIAQPVQTSPVAGATATGAAVPAVYPSNATVPLQINNVTEPVVNISVNGGRTVPVLVDTGSAGLVIPLRDYGLKNLSFPSKFGFGSYSGGLVYFYATMKGTVDFGNGIVTTPTPVNVVLFSFPMTFAGFLAGAGADGILGIGPNSVGPGPSIVTTALPGDLGQGVLIDVPNGVLVFGPNPLPARVSVPGSPGAVVQVQIAGGPLQRVSTLIDSGGVYGTILSSVAGSGLAPGTLVSVYTSDGQTLLYSYTITGTNAPTVISGGSMNTGFMPFAQQPVYISYSPTGVGTTIFDQPV